MVRLLAVSVVLAGAACSASRRSGPAPDPEAAALEALGSRLDGDLPEEETAAPAPALAAAAEPAAAPAAARPASWDRPLEVSGTVEPEKPWRPTVDRAWRVQEVRVRPRQWVEKGYLMAVLADPELGALADAEGGTGVTGLVRRGYKAEGVRNPFDPGYVSEVLVEPKEIVRKGGALLKVSPALAVLLSIPAEEAGRIGEGDRVPLRKKGADRTVPGRVESMRRMRGRRVEARLVLPVRPEGVEAGDVLVAELPPMP